MGMSIEEAIEGLKTERQLSVDNIDIYDSEESRRDAVYYVSILETAIETMRKYQKIKKLIEQEKAIFMMDTFTAQLWLHKIKKVVEDENDD